MAEDIVTELYEIYKTTIESSYKMSIFVSAEQITINLTRMQLREIENRLGIHTSIQEKEGMILGLKWRLQE